MVIAWLNFAAGCACDVELNRLGFIHPASSYRGNLSMITPDPEKTVRILKVCGGQTLAALQAMELI